MRVLMFISILVIMLSGCTADKYDGMIVKDNKDNYYLVNWRVGELVYLSPLKDIKTIVKGEITK